MFAHFSSVSPRPEVLSSKRTRLWRPWPGKYPCNGMAQWRAAAKLPPT